MDCDPTVEADAETDPYAVTKAACLLGKGSSWDGILRRLDDWVEPLTTQEEKEPMKAKQSIAGGQMYVGISYRSSPGMFLGTKRYSLLHGNFYANDACSKPVQQTC